MSVLEIESLSKRYRRGDAAAVDAVSLALESGEVVAVLGESGCGKTTLLRLIAGLERPDEGTVRIGGHVVASPSIHVPPEHRRVGMVFQDYALFPHLSVAKNVAFGLHGRPAQQRRARTDELLALVGIPELGDRFPHELSGGQRQRVALARALAPQPDLLLLDEPFSNLDALIRQEVRGQVRNILRLTGTTALLVVHDMDDAGALGDRVAVMRRGSIQQIGFLQTLRQRPATDYVAKLLQR